MQPHFQLILAFPIPPPLLPNLLHLLCHLQLKLTYLFHHLSLLFKFASNTNKTINKKLYTKKKKMLALAPCSTNTISKTPKKDNDST
jgi:hypothetical protein